MVTLPQVLTFLCGETHKDPAGTTISGALGEVKRQEPCTISTGHRAIQPAEVGYPLNCRCRFSDRKIPWQRAS